MNFLPNFPQDKLNHFFYGAWISFVAVNSLRNIVPIWILFISISALFLLFEVYQKVFHKGTFDWYDWVFGTMGLGLIILTAYI